MQPCNFPSLLLAYLCYHISVQLPPCQAVMVPMRTDKGKLTQPQPRCLLSEGTTGLSLWEWYSGVWGGLMAMTQSHHSSGAVSWPKVSEHLCLRDYIVVSRRSQRWGWTRHEKRLTKLAAMLSVQAKHPEQARHLPHFSPNRPLHGAPSLMPHNPPPLPGAICVFPTLSSWLLGSGALQPLNNLLAQSPILLISISRAVRTACGSLPLTGLQQGQAGGYCYAERY